MFHTNRRKQNKTLVIFQSIYYYHKRTKLIHNNEPTVTKGNYSLYLLRVKKITLDLNGKREKKTVSFVHFLLEHLHTYLKEKKLNKHFTHEHTIEKKKTSIFM